VLDSWPPPSGTPPDALILFYSGHGIEEGGEVYLAGQDSQLGDMARTGIAAARIQAWFDRFPHATAIAIFDRCRQGPDLPRASRRLVEPLGPAADRAVLSACDVNEYSHELEGVGLGQFTDALVRGLEGEADGSPADGLITMDELHRLTRRALARASERDPELTQSPRLLASRGVDIVVAKSGPAPPASSATGSEALGGLFCSQLPDHLDRLANFRIFAHCDGDGETEQAVTFSEMASPNALLKVIERDGRETGSCELVPPGTMPYLTPDPHMFHGGRLVSAQLDSDAARELVVGAFHFDLWPSCLAKVDYRPDRPGKLQVTARYWHTGHIVDWLVHDLDGDGTQDVAFVALNSWSNGRLAPNCKLPVCVVFRGTDFEGQGPPYRGSDDVPPGNERAYVVLETWPESGCEEGRGEGGGIDRWASSGRWESADDGGALAAGESVCGGHAVPGVRGSG
jgi:hypothetical protein